MTASPRGPGRHEQRRRHDPVADVALVEMPVTEEHVEMLPHGEIDHALTRAVLSHDAERLGVRYVDVPVDLVDHRWFADCVHVNGAGMRHASALVAAALHDDMAVV